MVDWRKVLVDYIAHVSEREGIYFQEGLSDQITGGLLSETDFERLMSDVKLYEQYGLYVGEI